MPESDRVVCSHVWRFWPLPPAYCDWSLEREEPSESETKGAKRSMKQIKMIVLAAVCLLAVAAFAQQSNPPAQPPAGGDQQQGGQRRGPMSVDDQLKNLTDRLSLTAD